MTTTAVGESFARALAAKDRNGLLDLLTDPIDFEALTPGRHWRATMPREVVDDIIFGVWFGPGDVITELRSVTCGQVADRERVSYRLAVGRGGLDHVVEQQAYFNFDGGRIDWIRILCSGYRPESGPGVPVDPDGEFGPGGQLQLGQGAAHM
ncbi:hypothetical protein [Nakamurella sp.]|uniref:hypothetical protein n=1 Tax=Nakamurella sp. TaxID=1869182 RepID=UPI00378429F5